MRIAVLSDTHIPTRISALPGRVYEVCAEADLVLHCGDLIEASVIRDLERFAPVKAVLGNMDESYLRTILPERITLKIEGHTVCMAHGEGTPMKLDQRVYGWFRDIDPDVVLFGHTHKFLHKTIGTTMILNPGSVAGKSGSRSMAVLTLLKNTEQEVEHIIF